MWISENVDVVTLGYLIGSIYIIICLGSIVSHICDLVSLCVCVCVCRKKTSGVLDSAPLSVHL